MYFCVSKRKRDEIQSYVTYKKKRSNNFNALKSICRLSISLNTERKRLNSIICMQCELKYIFV